MTIKLCSRTHHIHRSILALIIFIICCMLNVRTGHVTQERMLCLHSKVNQAIAPCMLLVELWPMYGLYKDSTPYIYSRAKSLVSANIQGQ